MGNFLTMAFRLAILITPRASVTVTTMGRPSGIAATAKLKCKRKVNDYNLLYKNQVCVFVYFKDT